MVRAAGSSRLHQHPKGASEVVGMGEGLKLPDLFRGELRECFLFLRDGFLEDAGKELRLRAKLFGAQAGGFAGGLDGAEIDMGGEVLAAGIGQEIVCDVVLVIGAQGAFLAGGRKLFFGGIAVVDGQHFSVSERGGGFAPPGFGSRTGFNDVAVGENLEQGRRKVRGHKASITHDGNFRPDEIFAIERDAVFEPFFFCGVPAEAVDGKGVEKLVAEDDGPGKRISSMN